MSGKKSPLVSVGIPTFNGAPRITKALSSLLNQDYPNLEIIISDNASLDKTRELCEFYCRKDPRITYHRQARNLGLLPNFEYLLHVAKGKYFIFLSDDDFFPPGILTTYVDFLEKNQDYSMVCGKVNYWTEGELLDCESGLSITYENPMLRAVKLYQGIKLGGMIHGMFRLKLGRKLGFKPVLGNDWHFLGAMAFKGKIFQLDQVGYEKSGEGTSSDFHKYTQAMGEHFFWAYIPFVKIAVDAFCEILYREKTYQDTTFLIRIFSATYAFFAIIAHYYFNITPRSFFGNVLRFFNMKTPNMKKMDVHRAQYLKLEKESTVKDTVKEFLRS